MKSSPRISRISQKKKLLALTKLAAGDVPILDRKAFWKALRQLTKSERKYKKVSRDRIRDEVNRIKRKQPAIKVFSVYR